MHKLCAFISVILLSFPMWVSAHHGLANFNLNVDISVQGRITDIAMINPHSWVYIEVTNADGSLTNWKCELRGGTVLRRSGWTQALFEVGSEITISGSPDRFEDNTCYTGTITFANGQSLDRYDQIIETEKYLRQQIEISRLNNGDPNINGDWAAEQVVMTDPRGLEGTLVPLSIADQFEPGEVPPGGNAFQGSRGTPESFSDDPLATTWELPSILPLTEAGKAALVGFDAASTDNPRLRCETTNIMWDWSFDNPVNRIEQTQDEIRLIYGTMIFERTIHLNETIFPQDLEPSRSGYSIGRWENDVLIVYTQGFLDGILMAGRNTPHSDAMRVVERFSIDASNGSLVRSYTAEDEKYFIGQFRGRDTMFVSSYPWEPYECDDRSYRSDI
ncbi:MAG: hypothetical protein HOH14_03905 [Gammaproteobacteria bacterium]|jgi:hypothetical protein|nr:hypothetical protein [Gammaproteobacteria bacterium]MBT6042621.1 hypothetical protein [Gammaproteobacteria bacterium]